MPAIVRAPSSGSAISSPSRRRPASFAAHCARRSARRCGGLRISSTRSSRSSTVSNLRGGITTPSSSSRRESAGIEAGVGPPTSAWCARLAANPASPSSAKTGVIRVMSGRWVPPANGSFRIQDSPGCWGSPITAATASGIEPRWTGMCSACMTSSPLRSNRAVEQSRRSLMLGECAERIRTAPISSQIERSLPVRTCSVIGSSVVIGPVPPRRSRGRRPERSSPGAGQGWSPAARARPVPPAPCPRRALPG